jgi:membrane protein required for colicin V production
MILFDVIILLILAGFVFYGLFFGLIRTIGSLAGFAIGLWVAIHYYVPVFEWARNLFFGYLIVGKLICFFVIFTLVNRIVSFGFAILNRAFDLLSIIPFLKTINRLGGALLGFIEGGLILGIILFTLSNNIYISGFFNHYLKGSQFVPFLIKFSQTLAPLWPQVMNKLKTFI